MRKITELCSHEVLNYNLHAADKRLYWYVILYKRIAVALIRGGGIKCCTFSTYDRMYR